VTADRFRRGLYRLEVWLDRNLYRIRRRLGLVGALSIHPYREMSVAGRLSVHGRVLAGAYKRRSLPDDAWWRNAWAVFRALATDEIPGAIVRAHFGDETADAETNEEGYFRLDLRAVGASGWQDVALELVSPGSAEAVAHVLAPPKDAEFGVISDFDDTVVVSEVPRPLKTLSLLLFRNAFSRRPFEGTADFYCALAAGSDGQRQNPVFYVSSGAWNFYDLLKEFLDHNGFPRGPILLRDIGLERDRFLAEGHEHKLRKIERILTAYPALPFILIGDTGQDDPKLYAEALRRHPGRIRAIYLRDVSPVNRAAVSELLQKVNEQSVVMRLFSSAAEAQMWAREAGWVAAEDSRG
jgi:phosphatidate phosphatase APP1